MVRIIIKGGVWKNTEDEVLKAAIAKYGKNQWARISSLLVRKTPKQCKARWYEWLDPSIKKTEWSKTEDEKLLHLAKLMPTQWRTIAPIVGRTATQCLERYQKLLDEAEAKENEELGLAGPGGEAGPSFDDVRKLRPGEIDPDPETKPARPDPIDMDEDEKEMLSEARARLANTQGKKAKRKARERQLEEARRLAMLQKRRELKAAGIMSGMRAMKKKKGIDYNADIPFEKKAAPGFYDTSEEQAKDTAAPIGQSLKRLEAKRRPAEDDAERKKRQRKDDDGHQTKFLAARDAQIQKLKEAEQISKRRKLDLPSAQVGEAELEDIVKIGLGGQSARELVDDGNEASGKLLVDYDGLQSARSARTPRTAPMLDNIMNEARNLLNMTVAQTPLLGDENTPLRSSEAGTGFEGATPRHQIAVTVNPLATPREGTGPESTPLRTPMRDSLSINQNDSRGLNGETPRDQKHQANHAKHALRASFSHLPKPENNFELLVPESEDAVGNDISTLLEDAAEREARLARLREEEARQEYMRQSVVVRAGLPRPANVDVDTLLRQFNRLDDSIEQQAVDIELVRLMQHDALAHPIPGTSNPGSTRSLYEHPAYDYIEAAKALVQSEVATALGFPAATPEQVKQGLLAVAKDEQAETGASMSTEPEDVAFDPALGRWVAGSEMNSPAKIPGIVTMLENNRETMSRDAARIAKTEKKLGVSLGGYQARSNGLSKRLVEAFGDLHKGQVDLESFSRLRENERAAGPRRVQMLSEEIERLEVRERSLQLTYKELSSSRNQLGERIEMLEEKLMADAEAENEAVLAGEEG